MSVHGPVRRWTVYEHGARRCEAYEGAPNPGDEEGIEVMPTADHDAALFDAFRGGYEAVYDYEVDEAALRQSFEEWLNR